MKKAVLIICGWLLVALGGIGIVLPLLPTTPFLLLAAICFSASSQKAYRFLLRSRMFGQYIEHYRTGRGVSLAAKVRAIVFLWALLILSAVVISKLWVILVLAAVGIGVTLHLLLLKTRPKECASVAVRENAQAGK